jgi:hypothetical protein
MGAKIFQKFMCHLQAQGTRRGTRSRFCTEDTQLWSDLQTCYPMLSTQCKNCSNNAEHNRCHSTKFSQ